MTHIHTWADLHPQVFKVFRQSPIEWPCEQIDTGLSSVYQPTVVKGSDGKLFTAGTEGQIFHSQDSGRNWTLLTQAPPLPPEIPEGLTRRSCSNTGIGVTERGTLLLVWCMAANDSGDHGENSFDESYHTFTWMTRSEDRGQTWQATEPFDPSPYDVIGDQATPVQLRDGRLMVPLAVQSWVRPGRAVPEKEKFFRSFIFSSDDDGRSWAKFSQFTDHSVEPSLLELSSGELVASIRYQRNKAPEDPPDLATDARLYSGTGAPTDVGCQLFQHSAFSSSVDGGKTWETPKIVTGSAQQSGSILRLSDETLILTFGRYGQRFMLSYDSGRTWSRSVYQLFRCGQYARSVVLDDDTIVTVHDSRETWRLRGQRLRCYDNSPVPPGEDVDDWGSGRLGVLRWKAPSRKKVEKDGFFSPRNADNLEASD
tara:strand:+ start:495 stop:1769 length:1275 start_codon:yes stop_codon:yes gene_type:complete